MEGLCLCGALRYEIDGPIGFAAHCHCSMCRKFHGAAFATGFGAPASGFRWRNGADAVDEFQSSAQGRRLFCRHCGSAAPVIAGDLAILPAGNIDGELAPKNSPLAHSPAQPRLRTTRPSDYSDGLLALGKAPHMFVGSKAPWYEITDDLPRHDQYPPEYPAPSVERPAVAPRPGLVLGSCLCCGVAFELDGAPEMMRNCHCSRCRRARSAAFATNLFYPAERLRFVRGEELVAAYKLPEAERFGNNFCRRCGSLVPRVAPGRPYAVVPAGALDTDPGARASAHIFVGSKAPWWEITDDLPRHAEMPG